MIYRFRGYQAGIDVAYHKRHEQFLFEIKNFLRKILSSAGKYILFAILIGACDSINLKIIKKY